MNATDRAHPHGDQKLLTSGVPLQSASAAVVLAHGRGATAESILELRSAFQIPEIAYLAPQAAGNTWYPYTFLAPLERNEPYLSSALRALAWTVSSTEGAGVATDRIVVGGFSQGACLAAEFVARNARRYGGLLVFSGGLIGPPGMARKYGGSLDGTPVFIGCSDRDPHIPLERVNETADVFRSMGADVTLRIYKDMGHTIIPDELDRARDILKHASARPPGSQASWPPNGSGGRTVK